ncbi:Uncharacterised protein [Mycobacteroides abscessus]|nr:Uncharacterised protein [Mycobacteroides abscessus]
MPRAMPDTLPARLTTRPGSSHDVAASAMSVSMPTAASWSTTSSTARTRAGRYSRTRSTNRTPANASIATSAARMRYATVTTADVAAHRGQPRRSRGKRTGWQMMTMTAARNIGARTSRAAWTPARTTTPAARARSVRVAGGSPGAGGVVVVTRRR